MCPFHGLMQGLPTGHSPPRHTICFQPSGRVNWAREPGIRLLRLARGSGRHPLRLLTIQLHPQGLVVAAETHPPGLCVCLSLHSGLCWASCPYAVLVSSVCAGGGAQDRECRTGERVLDTAGRQLLGAGVGTGGPTTVVRGQAGPPCKHTVLPERLKQSCRLGG